MFRSKVVFLAACFLTVLMTPALNSMAEVDETTQTLSITIYPLDEQVVSGYLNMNGDISRGRVCDFDCPSDKHDPYDLWILNATYGSLLSIFFADDDDPDYVNLKLELCWPNGLSLLICRHLWYTDDRDSNTYHSWGETEQFYFRISPVDGFGGEDSTYSIGVQVFPNRDIEPIGTHTDDFIGSGWVCLHDCTNGNNVMDIYLVRMIKGDRISLTLSGTYDSGLGERGYLSMSSMMEHDILSGDSRTQITMNERDEYSTEYTAITSGYYSIRVMSFKDSNDGDTVYYQLSVSVDPTHRDNLVDSDGDGWSDVVEIDCGFDHLSDLSIPLDSDSDTICDLIDSDDDGDGTPDNQDAFPLDPNEDTDTDSDGTGDNADTDDDADGVSDNWDDFPLDPSEQWDADGDGVGHNADNDDDGDGILDDDDADRDGDGFCNSPAPECEADEFPDNYREWEDTDGDSIGDNEDTDDDNDGILDSLDDCPKGVIGWQAIPSNDRDGDGCRDIDEDDDDDGDGVPDYRDSCLFTVPTPLSVTSVNEFGCADYELDSDDDGVNDSLDNCPESAVGEDVDGEGCVVFSTASESSSDGISTFSLIAAIVGMAAVVIAILALLGWIQEQRTEGNNDEDDFYKPNEQTPQAPPSTYGPLPTYDQVSQAMLAGIPEERISAAMEDMQQELEELRTYKQRSRESKIAKKSNFKKERWNEMEITDSGKVKKKG